MLIAAGAGLLLGAAFLDLLPEALEIGHSTGLRASAVLGLALLSFILFYGVDYASNRQGREGLRNRFGAAMLIFHSFRDGLAIGAAYTASHTAGYAVALGIAAHDFGDGMTTVILTTGGEAPTLVDYGFLLADALAPLAGGVLAAWWSLSPRVSVILLVLAAGYFLQMATVDFLPRMRAAEPRHRPLLVPTAVLGCAFIYAANRLLAI